MSSKTTTSYDGLNCGLPRKNAVTKYADHEQRHSLQRRLKVVAMTPRHLITCLVVGVTTAISPILPAPIAGAATDTVTTCSGSASVAGSLPYEVAHAASDDTVTISAFCPSSSPIVLTNTIDINTDLTIEGPGAGGVAISGHNAVEVLYVAPGVTATLKGLTIENGASTSGVGANTGGITNDGSLGIEDSIVEDNTASGSGINTVNTGGISNDTGATLEIFDSTVANNSSTGSGTDVNTGGIYNAGTFYDVVSTLYGNNGIGGTDTGAIYSSGTLQTVNATLDENSGIGGVGVNTGGIDSASGTADIGITILANSTGNDCSTSGGQFGDPGENLADDNSCDFLGVTDFSDTPAGLDPAGLQTNGGPTPTVALEPGSAAIGSVVNPLYCSISDQRGKTRPYPCDIGAFETDDYFSQALSFTSTPPTDARASGPTYWASATSSSGLPVVLGIDPTSSSVCSMAGSSVSFMSEGVCLIDANQAGNAGYSAASQVQQSFGVAPAPPAITSANHATATAGQSFSFTVTTSSSPVHSITKKGKLPKGLIFVDNGDGTATISGEPVRAGARHPVLRATFGTRRTKSVVTQVFTLTVEPAQGTKKLRWASVRMSCSGEPKCL